MEFLTETGIGLVDYDWRRGPSLAQRDQYFKPSWEQEIFSRYIEAGVDAETAASYARAIASAMVPHYGDRHSGKRTLVTNEEKVFLGLWAAYLGGDISPEQFLEALNANPLLYEVAYAHGKLRAKQNALTIGMLAVAGAIPRLPQVVRVKTHGIRHFPSGSPSPSAISSAIKQDLATLERLGPGQNVQRTITVGGQQVTYRGFGLPDGSVSVGTVYPGVGTRDISIPKGGG